MSAPGETLPALRRTVSARDIVMGAAASRDWQPQHHDHHHALAMNLPGIIMNAPTQTGWFHAHALSWAGPGSRIARWKLKLKRPVCPGADVVLSGEVGTVRPGPMGCEWVWLDLVMEVADEPVSIMTLLLCRPLDGLADAWGIPAAKWQIPALAPPLRN